MKKNSKKIEVEVYNTKKTFTCKEEAIEYFEVGCSYCDPNSSEYNRYQHIIFQLKDGKTYATDKTY